MCISAPMNMIAFVYAFDLIELDDEDLRRDPLAVRKATLARRLPAPHPAIRFCTP